MRGLSRPLREAIGAAAARAICSRLTPSTAIQDVLVPMTTGAHARDGPGPGWGILPMELLRRAA